VIEGRGGGDGEIGKGCSGGRNGVINLGEGKRGDACSPLSSPPACRRGEAPAWGSFKGEASPGAKGWGCGAPEGISLPGEGSPPRRVRREGGLPPY